MAALRIGTRGSALALVQARWVAARLPDAEIVEIATAGDRGLGVGDKSRWVSSLEAALLEGSIDVAVHSAKDVPGELADGTVIAAVPEREDPCDVLVGPLGPRVGTASLRRAAQLRAADSSLEVVELRGNVPTRLAKLDAGEVDGLVLAAAGLARLGVERDVRRLAPEEAAPVPGAVAGRALESARAGAVAGRAGAVGALESARAGGLAGGALELVPAPGQGALALQTRLDRAADVAHLSDPEALACVSAERALAAALGASCHTPMGALARVSGASELSLTGWVGLPDGSEWIRDTLVGRPERVGPELAARMIAVGARELLARAGGTAA